VSVEVSPGNWAFALEMDIGAVLNFTAGLGPTKPDLNGYAFWFMITSLNVTKTSIMGLVPNRVLLENLNEFFEDNMWPIDEKLQTGMDISDYLPDILKPYQAELNKLTFGFKHHFSFLGLNY
jgi:hypothetical protein